MYVSNYNIGSPLLGQPFYVLMHGYTGALDKVPAWLGEALIRLRGESANQLPDAVTSQLRQGLERRGYLTPLDQEQERQLLIRISTSLHEIDLATASAGFMFIPTYTCNLRCPYCFQSHDMHAGKDRYSQILSAEQVDAAFAIIDGFDRPGAMARTLGLTTEPNAEGPLTTKRSDIGLFGGEPLRLRTLPVVAHIVREAGARGRGVTAITNGVELPVFAELLGPGKIHQLQITLDGNGRLHDRRRVGPGFKTTFNIIADNIDLALDHQVTVSLRMNIDATNEAEIGPLNEFCRRRGWTRNVRFSANAAVVTSEHPRPGLIEQADLVRRIVKLRVEGAQSLDTYDRIATELLQQCIQGDGYPFKTVANCSSETGLLMFDPFFDVYACWEEIGEPANRIGTYGSDGLKLKEETAAKWLTRFPGAIEQCSACPYAMVHASGCAKHAEKISGTIFAAACESFQAYFPQTLAIAYEAFESEILCRTDAVTPETQRDWTGDQPVAQRRKLTRLPVLRL